MSQGGLGMYGTIMRAKIKAGQLEAFRRYAQESGGPDAAAGWVSSEFEFKDKESYVKNANAPRTNDNYNQMMKFFEAPPEWIDVTYVAFQGEPLKEYMTAGAAPTS